MGFPSRPEVTQPTFLKYINALVLTRSGDQMSLAVSSSTSSTDNLVHVHHIFSHPWIILPLLHYQHLRKLVPVAGEVSTFSLRSSKKCQESLKTYNEKYQPDIQDSSS